MKRPAEDGESCASSSKKSKSQSSASTSKSMGDLCENLVFGPLSKIVGVQNIKRNIINIRPDGSVDSEFDIVLDLNCGKKFVELIPSAAKVHVLRDGTLVFMGPDEIEQVKLEATAFIEVSVMCIVV